MKARILHAAAAVLAAGAMPLAFAQSSPGSDFGPLPPGNVAKDVVTEPIASVSPADGGDGELANTIAQELISEPLLKGTNVTVQPGDGAITLTGSVSTKAQEAKAVEIATARAGEGKVVNVIHVDEL